MTTRLLALAACSAALTLASATALAQEASLFPHELSGTASVTEAAVEPDAQSQRIVITGRALTMRERVVLALMDAIRNGTLDRTGEGQPIPLSNGSFVYTRGEVVADLFKAKAEGRFDTSGEHWIGHDHGGRDPRVVVMSSDRLALLSVASRR